MGEEKVCTQRWKVDSFLTSEFEVSIRHLNGDVQQAVGTPSQTLGNPGMWNLDLALEAWAQNEGHGPWTAEPGTKVI